MTMERMSRANVVCEPQLVVLPGAVWREELEAELTRLGHKQPRTTATKVLQRIVARSASWPRDAFRVAETVPPTRGEEAR